MRAARHNILQLLDRLTTALLMLLALGAFAGAAHAAELTILYSNDIRGDIEPCG